MILAEAVGMGDGKLHHSIWKFDFGKPERGKTRYNMMKKTPFSDDTC